MFTRRNRCSGTYLLSHCTNYMRLVFSLPRHYVFVQGGRGSGKEQRKQFREAVCRLFVNQLKPYYQERRFKSDVSRGSIKASKTIQN